MSGYTQCVLYDTKRSDQLFRKSASFGGKCSGGTSHEESGEVILEGAGQGHGIGLCQRGAKAMAEEGSSFRQILNHYFPNTGLILLGEHVASSTRKERLLPPYSSSLAGPVGNSPIPRK